MTICWVLSDAPGEKQFCFGSSETDELSYRLGFVLPGLFDCAPGESQSPLAKIFTVNDPIVYDKPNKGIEIEGVITSEEIGMNRKSRPSDRAVDLVSLSIAIIGFGMALFFFRASIGQYLLPRLFAYLMTFLGFAAVVWAATIWASDVKRRVK